MEIVPALIYKIFQYGITGAAVDRDKAAGHVPARPWEESPADKVGDWAQKKIGVNPVELFKDVYDIPAAVEEGTDRPSRKSFMRPTR